MVRAIVAAPPQDDSLGFGTRLWFAWVCFFRILFDGLLARRLFDATYGTPALPPAPEPEAKKPEKAPEPPKPVIVEAPKPTLDAALQLLALFQREGRFVDFLQEDVTTFSDADVGAAARVVHQGCKKALGDHAKIRPVRSEDEGSKVTVSKGTPPSQVKLIGNVAGEPPFTGTLRHRGWRIDDLHLPTAIDGHDLAIVAPAEVEL